MMIRTALQLLALAPAWQWMEGQTMSNSFVMKRPEPTNLSIYLDGWKAFKVVYKGETVTIDPQELFDALKEA